MTERLKGVVVAFDVDIREDDVQTLVNAIRCFRHVLSVEPVMANADDWVVEQRVRDDLSKKLWEVLHPKRPVA